MFTSKQILVAYMKRKLWFAAVLIEVNHIGSINPSSLIDGTLSTCSWNDTTAGMADMYDITSEGGLLRIAYKEGQTPPDRRNQEMSAWDLRYSQTWINACCF